MFTLSIKWFDFNWKILIWSLIWCAASPSSVPTVWSLAGPKLSEVFLPLTHWDWPTLLSSQPHVPFSNEQPTNSELVSLATRRGEKAELKTWFCRQKAKITAAPLQMPSVTVMSSTAMKPLLLVSASMSTLSIEEQRKWLRRYYSLQHLYLWATFSILEKVWWCLQTERTWSSCFHCCYCETWAGSQMVQNEGTPSACPSRCWRTHKWPSVHLFSANHHFLVWITKVLEQDPHSLRNTQVESIKSLQLTLMSILFGKGLIDSPRARIPPRIFLLWRDARHVDWFQYMNPNKIKLLPTQFPTNVDFPGAFGAQLNIAKQAAASCF